ncbi:oxidative damage protection protein [Candidatus Pseudomonas adelgestsugas]|uniref:Probable Fe(2+)-trafficking protein n=1 Tax=Candidatus Pseudomonas adelgestsugas TaxID=1302376 RepID=A0ABX5R864_9PSED|nr:oxidative damage protection protein [Candidatus Pseudomonas adelgestsugas]QAX81523.1 putative Fe(2+)-trafficking protein [Candidatus Pseudomonas adelgestsugas]
MTRTIMCRKYKEKLPGLDYPPYPGASGYDIYNHVSAKAWSDWLKHQTLIINAKRLNMTNAEDRKYLTREMDKFLCSTDLCQGQSFISHLINN